MPPIGVNYFEVGPVFSSKMCGAYGSSGSWFGGIHHHRASGFDEVKDHWGPEAIITMERRRRWSISSRSIYSTP